MRALLFAAVSSLIWFTTPASGETGATQVRIPRIGCPADGQVGPQKAPPNGTKVVQLSPAAANRLAWYVGAYGTHTLAPRGWGCIELSGSNGSMLLVTPQAVKATDFLSKKWKGITGFGVTVLARVGDTSGRFAVAEVAARVFPAARKFVNAVIAEGLEQPSDFPAEPYPHDSLTYRTGTLVEFTTAPHAKGLGTLTWLEPNARPILGMAQLNGDPPSLLSIAVRLPAGDDDLNATIISQAEGDGSE
ncbi:MAG TPA: hypothetical protein VGG36_02095 [Rhizomicrobium sp.]|jgi:hypothetical protein